MFTHRHARGEVGGDQPVSKQLAFQCLQDLKRQFPQGFSEPIFPTIRDTSVQFEHRIRLKNEGAPPLRRKIYPLDSEELAELKRQITDMSSKN